MLPPVKVRGVPAFRGAHLQLSVAGIVGLEAVGVVEAGNHRHAADGDVNGAVGLGGGGEIDQAGEVLQSLLALIHQLVGAAAGGLGRDDLLVEGGNGIQVLVAGGDVVLDGGVQIGLHGGKLGGDLVELGGHLLGALHGGLAQGKIARIGGEALKGVEEIGEPGGQAVGAVRGGGGSGGR